MIFDLFFQNEKLCPFCQKEFLEGDYLCEDCRRQIPLIAGRKKIDHYDLFFPYLYHGLIREKIHEYKFYGKRYLYEPLSRLLLEGMKAQLEGDWDCFVCVPLDSYKRKKRGFHQLEELLEYPVKEYHKPLKQALVKNRRTKDQHLLEAEERKNNLKGAFELSKDLSNQKILLVDDVATTGATLLEAARVLEEAGPQSIVFYTLTSVKPEEFYQG